RIRTFVGKTLSHRAFLSVVIRRTRVDPCPVVAISHLRASRWRALTREKSARSAHVKRLSLLSYSATLDIEANLPGRPCARRAHRDVASYYSWSYCLELLIR